MRVLVIFWGLLLTAECTSDRRRKKERSLENLINVLLANYERNADTEYRDAETTSQAEVDAWLKEINERYREVAHNNSIAGWNYESDINNETAARKSEVSLEYVKFQQDAAKQAKDYLSKKQDEEGNSYLTPDTLRQLNLFARDSSVRDSQKIKQLDEVESRLAEMYANGKVYDKDGDAYSLEPDIENVMANSRDPKMLEWAWKSWRDASGKKMRNLFTKMVQLQNEGAKQNGYRTAAEVWIETDFDVKTGIEDLVDKLWTQLKPMYQQLHTFVRGRLQQYYNNSITFPSDNTIPAHLLGNMWAQEWQNIFPIVQPFKDIKEMNYDLIMKTQHYDVQKMFRTAENFYASIGFENMTDEFWEKSILKKPANRSMICHASAWDFYTNDDFRIKMCTNVSMEYFETIHHEMGHIQYFMSYKGLPTIYRRGANGGFHEAIGDTIALSVRTRKHLETIGLLKSDKADDHAQQYETDINYLMRKALFKVAFLPFGYLIDKWRWKVFRGEITKENYNAEWWKMRKRYQGITPPVQRNENDFDPGAKFHVAASVPYIRYFISFVVQFQFYEAMCKESGHTGPLYECDFYKSLPAGEKFKKMLTLGGSKPWEDALETLTGTREIKADSIIQYFKPLTDWLQKQNENSPIWQE